MALSRALGDVTGCAKTYVALFAEAEGFAQPRAAGGPGPGSLSAPVRVVGGTVGIDL